MSPFQFDSRPRRFQKGTLFRPYHVAISQYFIWDDTHLIPIILPFPVIYSIFVIPIHLHNPPFAFSTPSIPPSSNQPTALRIPRSSYRSCNSTIICIYTLWTQTPELFCIVQCFIASILNTSLQRAYTCTCPTSATEVFPSLWTLEPFLRSGTVACQTQG
ncbi:hypothetical protein CPB84DRAFT_1766372 [Gymnopilus junonius]|uniref:Uncharacterized protein n=1 Tax=Gymnopilus junonius TaxID=109634 RepID=A0A9P5TS85_GYMJU|nr:hypothetical protein CPB84DRAFT_1766372 [Gymnopilus junonius]